MRIRKKVFFIIPSIGGGGAEKVVNILLNQMDKDKFDFKLILFNKRGIYLTKIPPYVEVEDFKKRNRWDFLYLIFKLRNRIKEQKPDILFSWLDYANIITILSTLFLKHRSTIIISEQNYHRVYLQYVRFKALRKLLVSFTYRKADKIIVCSEGIKQILASDFSIEKDKIKVIYSPLTAEPIHEANQEEAEHPFFKNRENSFIIITAGRLTLQKNQSLLIKAFALARETIPAFLIILGQGELEKDLKTLAKQLKVENYIDFVGFQKNLSSWIKKSDLFVLSSSWEGMPLALIEAMACGVPVVSTSCPTGPDEVITNQINGLLVPTEDKDALAAAIFRLFKDKSLRERLAAAGSKRSMDFSAKKIVAQYQEYLLTI